VSEALAHTLAAQWYRQRKEAFIDLMWPYLGERRRARALETVAIVEGWNRGLATDDLQMARWRDVGPRMLREVARREAQRLALRSHGTVLRSPLDPEVPYGA